MSAVASSLVIEMSGLIMNWALKILMEKLGKFGGNPRKNGVNLNKNSKFKIIKEPALKLSNLMPYIPLEVTSTC